MRIEFRHQAVRDLAWVISSAPLLRDDGVERVTAHWCRIAFLDRLPWLRHLDNHPDELERWLEAGQHHLLGHYFEALIAFWLQQWPRMRLLASRLPVSDGQRVVGEFDFLFFDRYREQTFQWECAVKFFLRTDQSQDRYDWLGPNPRDSLAGKYRKVFDKQLRLAALPEAQALLAARGIDRPCPQAFIKGRLFYPAAGDWQRDQPIPPDTSPQHLRGWWCHSDRTEQIPSIAADSRWVSLDRLQWLSPAYRCEHTPGWEHAALLDRLADHFADSDKPLLLAELRPGKDGMWREASRGFVVPAHWPHRAPQG